MHKLIILVLIIVSIDVNAEFQTYKHTGLSKYGTCKSIQTKAENYCKQSNSAPALKSNAIEQCMDKCQQVGININCSISFDCDTSRRPETKSWHLSSNMVYSGRNPFSSDSDSLANIKDYVCKRTKKKASKKLKEQCKDYNGYLFNKSYSSCNCVRIYPRRHASEPAFECKVTMTATCNKEED